MKKFFIAICVVALLAGALTLTACGGSQDEALVGVWEWDMGPAFTYTFRADGTGSRGVPGIEYETFRWSTSGDRLNVNRDQSASGEIRNERWTYTISGNRLTIDSRQEAGLTFTYIRR